MKNLQPKKVKGRVAVLKALPYRDCMVYIRQIDGEIFMYDLVFKGEIYSSYLIITPKKGKTKLTKSEISQAGALILTGAMATLDELTGNGLAKREKEVVNTFELARSNFDQFKQVIAKEVN